MASMDYEKNIVNQLLHDNTSSLKINTSNKTGPFYIPKALLTGVSPKLADLSSPVIFDHVGEDAFRMFVTWLLYRKFDKRENKYNETQIPLAQAWNFGAEYDIPDFQNAVMYEILECIEMRSVEPEAVQEAYRPTTRNTLLQQAFIAYLAKDMCVEGGDHWERKDFVKYGMESVPEFYLDLVQAMAAGCCCVPSVPGVEDLLVAKD